MILSDIYDRFSIPGNLRTHMLRVAGVGKIICKNLSSDIKVDKELIIKALLVHDMGNIVKFDFSVKSIHTDPVEIVRLQKIKTEFIAKYGSDAHEATERILEEIQIDAEMIPIIYDMVIEKLGIALTKQAWDLMITTYADYRIAPHGIVSIQERINDLVARLSHKPSSHWSSTQKVEKYRANLAKCEVIIQKNCFIDLKSINDQMVEKYFEDFLAAEIV